MNLNKIDKVKKELNNTKLLIVTKYSSLDDIKELIKHGYKDFGENRVEVLKEKINAINDSSINWHFIGHLQRNKAKEVINKISCLHSLDSLKLADIIEKERNEVLDCFIEVNLLEKESRSGVKLEDIECFSMNLKKYKKINVLGLMVMADKDMSNEDIKTLFMKANALNKMLGYKELSMGMSHDYKIAIECGSTIVRLGSILL